MSDDGMTRIARDGFGPLLELAPEAPPFDEILLGVNADPHRQGRSSTSLGVLALAGSVGAIVMIGTVIWLGGADHDQAAAPTTTSRQTTTSTAASPDSPLPGFSLSEAESMPIVAASLGPIAPIETGAPLTAREIDRDNALTYTNETLPTEIVEGVRAAAIALLEEVDGSPPYRAEVAFTLFENTHAIITYGDGRRAHVVVGNNPRAAHSNNSTDPAWIDVEYGRRDSGLPIVQLTWMGLPDHASYVVADHIGIDDTVETENFAQQVTASSSFTAILKPDWTQYVTLTAFDVAGNRITSSEVLVDGGTCSAGDGSHQMAHARRRPPEGSQRRCGSTSVVAGCRMPLHWPAGHCDRRRTVLR